MSHTKKMICRICNQEGHEESNVLIHPQEQKEEKEPSPVPRRIIRRIRRTPEEEKKAEEEQYNEIIREITEVATSIQVHKTNGDGRIDSAIKEVPFLTEMKRLLEERHPTWKVEISPPRASCDLMVQRIRINLKLTDCKSSDNSVNKPSIYYSITGLTTYPYSSNWNEFLDRLLDAKQKKQIKTVRHKPTEYHYLVKNKLTGDVLLKPIFDIHTYVSNPSNDLQINWKNEFTSIEYATEESDYLKKVESLLRCIQTSVREMIERTRRFAEADLTTLLSSEETEEESPCSIACDPF